MSLFGARRHPRTAPLPAEGRLPVFEGATGWLNSSPLTPEGLAGKVVLVDFWTYTCINWLRTLAFVRAWSEKYRDRGLLVIGVHTPEFPFEREVHNVREAVEALRVEYPVALDSDYGVWSAFANRYWPAVYLADAEGRIRYHHFGEGDYDDGEWMIQHLLREAGSEAIDEELVSVTAEGFEAQADWTNLRSPETYLGYAQGHNLDSPGGVGYDEPHSYVAPESLQLNTWAMGGNWTIEEPASVLNEAGGRIAFRFHARDVHLVLRSRAGTVVPFRVLVDGEAPGAAHGLDVDEEGRGTLVQPRLSARTRARGRSRTARSRSHSSRRASRRTSSPSASDGPRRHTRATTRQPPGAERYWPTDRPSFRATAQNIPRLGERVSSLPCAATARPPRR